MDGRERRMDGRERGAWTGEGGGDRDMDHGYVSPFS